MASARTPSPRDRHAPPRFASPTVVNKSTTAPAQHTRSRTFKSCLACRGRHLKCDEARPVCGLCRRLNLPCERAEARLHWVSEVNGNGDGSSLNGSRKDRSHPDSHRAASFRFQFSSEDERNDMSINIVQSLGHRSAGDVMLSLDDEASNGNREPLQAGPFGVFRAFDPPEELASILATAPPYQGQGDDGQGEVLHGDALPMLHLETCDAEVAHLLGHQHSEEPNSTVEPWSDLFDTAASMPSILSQEFVWTWPSGDTDSTRLMPSSDLFPPDCNFTASPPRPPSVADRGFRASLQPPITQSSSQLPPHTQILLRYYKENFGSARNPSIKPTRIAPWLDILFPCALETYAELSLWGTSSHRRLSILCTVLAKSAFHMHQAQIAEDSSQSPWLSIGRKYQRDAQDHLQKTFQCEVGDMLESKYDEVLMAILALSIVSLLFNCYKSTTVLLLDAERLIRLHGLSLPKYFRQRVLHHMYTHFRVLAESIDFNSSNTSQLASTLATDLASSPSSSSTDSYGPDQRVQSPPASLPPPPSLMASSSANFTLLASDRELVKSPLRKFRVSKERLGNHLDVSRKKPAEIAYADIHLDVSGHWSESFYIDMYGVPESLMTLLSQTVSLANEKSRLEKLAHTDPAISSALNQHIKTLEHNIWSWPTSSSETDMPVGPARPPHLGFSSSSGPDNSRAFSETQNDCHRSNRSQALLDHSDVRSLTLAMHQSLLVYFYRFVYCVSPMAVQEHVRRALEYAASCMTASVMEDQDFATSVGWAIFVAACEAMSPELQEQSRRLLENMDTAGILFIGSGQPSQIAQEVWKSRERTVDWSMGWKDVLREHRV
ncbi:fungal-specific transcription factor domain-containing protein [Hypoxylon sp. FL0890]|nr:fungal-specific transcription factor domain-containing protein [Hypoxylon sp. FL0890]